MGSGRAKKFAAMAVAVVLLVISATLVAFAATAKKHPSASAATPAKVTPVRAIKYACTKNLYNAKKVLRFVARPAKCKTASHRVNFAADAPVFVCRKEHGGFTTAARARRFPYPRGIRPWGPAGLVRWVANPSDCAPPNQPNETAHTLPASLARTFCAAKKGGELRWVTKAEACDAKEFPVVLAAAVPVVGQTAPGDPVAKDDSSSTDEDTGVSINVLANDKNTASSNSNSALTVDTIDPAGTKGTATKNADGTIGYSPNGKFDNLKAGQSATDSFKYRVKKGALTSEFATVTVTINGVNDPPVANDDSATTDAVHTKTISVLANDTDAEGDSLSVGEVDTTGTQGTVTKNGDGTITYDPNHKFDSLGHNATATDTFKYKANDGSTDSTLFATVTLTISGKDQTPSITTTSGNTPYTENAAATVVDGGITVADADDSNFSGATSRISVGKDSGDQLVFTNQNGITGSFDSPTGTLTLSGNATKADYQTALRSIKFQSSSDNPATAKTVEFKVNDGALDSNAATRNLTVTRVNDAPVVTTESGKASYTEGSSPLAPSPLITVADPDNANLTGGVVSITANFTSADGDTLNFTSQNGITGNYNSGTGVLTLSGSSSVVNYQTALRSVTFSLTSHNPSTATRAISVKVNDGALDSNTATRDIDVVATNDAPVANDDTGSTNEDTTLSVAAPGVIGNDTDAEGDGLTAALVTGPAHASSFSLHSDGSYDYTPSSNYNGSDSFTYKVNDGTSDSNTATVSLTVNPVNDAPVAADDTTNTDEDTALSVNAAGGVLGNDSDPDGDSITASLVSGPSHAKPGTFNLHSDGSYDYTPDTDYNGSDSFTYKVSDGSADSNTATVNITVNAVNDAPMNTVPGSQSPNEDTSLTFSSGNGNQLSTSDVDAGGSTVSIALSVQHGTLTLGSTSGLTFSIGDGAADQQMIFSGTLTNVNSALNGLQYMPDLNFNGPDFLSFNTDDNGHTGSGGQKQDTDSIEIDVAAVNDAPVANDDTYSVGEDGSLTPDAGHGVLANDTDVDTTPSSLKAAKVTDPAHGSLTLNQDGSFTYTPATGYNGSDSFTYKVNDGSADSNTATVNLTVSAVNDAPENSMPVSAQTTNEDTPLTFSTANSNVIKTTDVDADPGNVSVELTVSSGTLTLGSTGGLNSFSNNGTGDVTFSGTVAQVNTAMEGLTYTPNANVNGADTLTMVTNDNGNTGSGGAKTDTDSIGIQVDPVNDAPVATGDSATTDEDTAVTSNVLANDTDVDGDSLFPKIVTFPTNGGVVVNVDNTITYTPNGNYSGPDSYTYKASDGALDSNTVTVNITVGAVNDAPENTVPGTQTINEDSNLVLSGGNAPSFDDADLGGSDATITLTVAHGTLTLGSTPAGLTSVNGNGTGTVVVTGTKSDLNTALAGLTYNPSANFNGADSISMKTEDNGNTGSGGNKSDTDSIGVNVTAVNDGPVNSVPGSQSTDEDTPLTFSSGNPISFDDSDSATDNLTITVTTTNGTSKLSTTTGLTGVSGDGTNSITASGPESALNAALAGLVFTPTADYFGAASVELLTNDNGHNGTGGALSDDDTVAITVNSVNDAPIITTPANQATAEDTLLTFSPAPTVTDADSGGDDVRVGVSVSHGTLTLATTVGITSFTTGDGSDDATIIFDAPLSVANNALNGLKYTPDADFFGGDSLGVTISDLGHNGSGGTKTDAQSTDILVTAVNDAPVVDLNGGAAGTGTNPTFTEVITHNNSVQLAPNTTVSDVDDTNMESADVTITNKFAGDFLAVSTAGTSIISDGYNSTTGVLHLHGSAPKSDYAQVLQTVTYGSTAAPPSATDRSITFTVNDGDVDSASATSTVQVVPLNTPPIVDLDTTNAASFDSSATFTEDSPAVNIAPNPSITDADAADTHMESATITLTNRPDGANETLATDPSGSGITVDAYDSSTGVLFLHGHGLIADYETFISHVTYADVSENPDTTDRDITVVVNDGQANSTPRHATVQVNRHNDPIQNTVPGAQATDEDAAITFTAGNSNLISVSDADAGAGAVKVTVSSTHGSFSALQPAGGTRTGNGTHSLELTGTVSAVNASLDGITYTPDANYNGSDTITVLSDDQGNSGGSATTDSDTIAVTLNAVNDAPSNTVPGSQTVNEDTALPFSSGTSNQISVSDVDAGSNPIKVKLEVAHGALKMTTLTGLSFSMGTGAGDPVLEFTGTQTNINNALNTLSYLGTLNYNGPDTLTVTTNDQGNSGSGSALTDVDTVGITVNPVNDAPSATGDSYSTNEDTQLNVDAATGVLSNDDDIDTPHSSITAVKVTDPANGSVTLNPDGSFTYNPNANFNGSDSFTYKANDGSLDSNTVTVNLTVNAVNDAPVNSTPAPQTVDEDTTLTFNSGNGNPISTSDVDAGASQMKVTLSALHGGITLSQTTGLSFACAGCAGDGAGDSTMTFTGTLTNVNAALNGASYLGTLNYNGPEQITLTVNDQGATGAGGAKQDSDVIDVTVNPVNDSPVATDESFTSTSGPSSSDQRAIGNTTLNVNDTATRNGTTDGRPPTPDPTDTSPTTDRPHKEITGDILANDTDVDNNNNEFSVVPGTFATNDGGTVTIQSDGDFNFEPAPSTSCTDNSDFFDYTVTDNVSSGAGPNPGTDTGRVTVAITGCVWYVNNNDAQGNSGTSEKPFDTLAQAQTASQNNQTTFVYDGDDTTTGYNAGYTMNTGESLLSEGATLPDPTNAGTPLHSADAANKASITNNNADVVTLAGGASVKSFNIDPQGTGGGIFGTGLGATTVTLDDLNVVDNATKGTQPGLELDTNTGTTTNISNLTVNNGDGSSATTGDTGVKLNNTGTVNFASTGTISITTNGAAGLVAAAGVGTTSLGSASTFDDITVTNSLNGGVSLTGTTGSGTAFGDGSGNDMQLTTTSGSPAAFSVQTGGSFSVPSAGQSDISATGGPAVDVVSSSGSTMAFDSVSSTNSANDGINIDSVGTGTFSATSGTIGGEAGIGFDLNGGSGAMTYPGTFNNGSGPLAAEVTGRTGGVVSLSGSMNDTADAGGGVNIAGNTGGSTVFSGATKQYNTGASDAVSFTNSDGHTFVLSGGGSDIDTTSGNGINATTAGTFQVSGTGNTLDSTALAAGNRGINIADTDISATGVNFDHVNTSGGTNGIRINNQSSSSGQFNVTGIGGTCTAADQTGCSGGVIQSATGAGIELTSDGGPVSLNHVNVKNGGDDGIRATTVGVNGGTGIALTDSVIATNGTADVAGNDENGLDWTNVIGNTSLTRDVITGSSDFNAQIVNNASGTQNLTVAGSTFSNSGVNAALSISIGGTATMNSIIGVAGAGNGNTFTNNKGAGIDVGSTASSPSATSNMTIQNNTVTGKLGTITDGGIYWTPDGKAKGHILNNTVTGVSATAMTVQSPGAGDATTTTDATVENNVIGTAGDPQSGSDDGDGLTAWSPGDGTSKFLLKNNTIHGFDKNGIYLRGAESTNGADSDFTVTGNTITDPDPTHSETAIVIDAGALSTDVVDVCADVGGAGALANTFSGSLSAAKIGNFWLSLRFVNSKLKAPGYVGTTFTDRKNYFLGRNTGFGTDYVEDGAQNLTTPSPANCLQPALPTTG